MAGVGRGGEVNCFVVRCYLVQDRASAIFGVAVYLSVYLCDSVCILYVWV